MCKRSSRSLKKTIVLRPQTRVVVMQDGIHYYRRMHPKRPNSPSPQRHDNRRPPASPAFDRLIQRPVCPEDDRPLPKIVAKGAVWHPFLFRRQLGDFDPKAQPGDLVEVVNTSGITQGFGLFNPKAEIAVRLLRTGVNQPDDVWWSERMESAVALRREVLKLDSVTDAYRVIHAEADGLPGLVVDKFGDVLVAECFSLGMYQRAEAILSMLEPICGTRHGVMRPGPNSIDHEGFMAVPTGSEGLPAKSTIQEFGTQFRVDFAGGHKTGFYCDQRDNRKKLAEFCAGKSVLDLCCYTGGFAVQAKKLGQAEDVTGVELDESAAALARDNAKLNKIKLNIVQADAFSYMRDMLRNGKKYDVVVLDPPKLIRSRDEIEDGRRKYYDFNRLAMQLVAPDGILLTCSCSGLLDLAEFSKIVCAAPEFGRRVQVLIKGGAAADHPIATICPESEYLKTMWLRLE
ncbi:MAG: class I SAM-dependent rRNA methyltransferase [Planctomycetota bacterium]